MPQRRQCRVRGVSCAYARYLVRKPDAGKLHVRFDERDLETGLALPRQISTLRPGSVSWKSALKVAPDVSARDETNVSRTEPTIGRRFQGDLIGRLTQG